MSQNAEDHLPSYQVRPRFQIESPYSVEDLADKIKAALKEKNAPCRGHIIPGYATLYIPREEQHYWSPQLTLSLEETDSGCTLSGLYGPRPSVWTMFVFFYAIIAFAIMVIGIIGGSHLTLDQPAGILWFIPLLLLVFFSLYFVAYYGQKLGHDQMVILQTFIEKQLESESEK